MTHNQALYLHNVYMFNNIWDGLSNCLMRQKISKYVSQTKKNGITL